jgi:hypothetical protein
MIMAFVTKAEQAFQDKLDHFLEKRNFRAIQKLFLQFGVYLDLIEPLPNSGPPAEIESKEDDEGVSSEQQ